MQDKHTTASITIDRETRAALHWQLRHELAGSADALGFATCREHASEALDRAHSALRALDALGWDEDDPRTEYTLPVDAGVARWLRLARVAMIDALACERSCLAALEDGNEDHRVIGHSIEGSVHMARENIDGWVLDLIRVDRVLGQFDEMAVA